MEIVLFFQSTTKKSWRLKLGGVYRFARANDWFVQVVDGNAKPREIRRALTQWSPAGCLVDRALAQGAAPDRIFGHLPTVYLDQRTTRTPCRHPRLVHDSAATARLAGRELLRLNRAAYAFLGMERGYFWEREREAAFRRLCADAGKPMFVLRRDDLAASLAALPKPCGVLAVNDCCAVELWPAAAALGLSIPGDVAVVGIDNDEPCAESVMPGLTSVEPDFEGAGYALAQLLADEIARRRRGGRRRGPAPLAHYGASRLVRRGSTLLLADGGDPRVIRALEHIRRNACRRGISTDEVVAVMGCSRRLATTLFRQAVGQSILQEIQARRLDEAMRLLQNPRQQIEAIADLCGYGTPSFLKRIFKQRTGLSMRAWRKTRLQLSGD
ncbi:MAG: substrate-binding domain-containing protein [Kiritimatiellia bacterium]